MPGIKWIEFDLAITADEQLIVIHDDDFERTTDASGEVSMTSFSAVRGASAGSWYGQHFLSERIPTLVQVIDFANTYKINLNIELKGVTGANGTRLTQRMISLLQEELKKLDKDVEVLISSFNFMQLRLAAKSLPQYPRAVLFERCCFLHL